MIVSEEEFFSNSVINCKENSYDIKASITKALSSKFKKEKLLNLENPYGSKNSSNKIIRILSDKKLDLDKLIKKEFYNVYKS